MSLISLHLVSKPPFNVFTPTAFLVSKPELWSQIDDSRVVEKIWLRPSLSEVFDLEWSADSTSIIIGAVETKVVETHVQVLYTPNELCHTVPG